jgi:hypothetical protein
MDWAEEEIQKGKAGLLLLLYLFHSKTSRFSSFSQCRC